MSIGLRIQQARRRRGLSLRDLAAREVGVSHTTLAKYERGVSTPNSATLLRISRVLGFGLDYFLRPTRIGEIRPAYRKKDGLGAREEGQIIEEIRDWLERYLTAEQIRGEDPHFAYPEGFPYSVRTLEEVEAAALALRAVWAIGLDPLDNLTGHLEDKGIRVGVIDAHDDFDACAFLAYVEGSVPVIVTNLRGPGDRQRYNLAHELGHLVLDVGAPLDEERACHRFAGAFLAPRSTLLEDMGERRQHLSPVELFVLKQKYGVSMGALVHRARDLGIIKEAEKKRLYDDLQELGWKVEEPGGPIEHPTRFRVLVLQALAENLIGQRRAAELYKEGPLATDEERRVLKHLVTA